MDVVRRFGGISEDKPSGIMIGCALGDDGRLIEGAGELPLAGELPWYCDLAGEIPLEVPELAVLLVGDGLFPRLVTLVLTG